MNSNESPETISVLSYLVVLIISAWGGMVNFLHKSIVVKRIAFNLIELVAEICISCFAGVVVFFICLEYKVDPLATAALVGIAGHMGSKLIFKLESYVTRKFLGE